MKQIIQSYRDGEIWLAEVPAPALRDNGLLVNTATSVVSAGTEKMITELAKKSLIGKAKARPDLVKKVIAKVKTEGFFHTWQKVSAKLDTPIALGYSCAGTVIEVGRNVVGLEFGDRVACGGAGYATHAEFNFVPKNLCVRIPPEVSFEDAAFTTLGAVALQGVRQADARLGERMVVIGLGLLGLLSVQMLKASGCHVLGYDPDKERCDLARELGADEAVSDGLVAASTAFTSGVGADAVLITAGTSSNEPVTLAAEAARLRGRVVVVGLVGMEIPRDEYYKKELDLRLSRSYGPGRYDPEYEERGRDYPLAYVRWTEKRNMEAFLQLVADGKVQPRKLVTHRFPIDESLKAYEIFSAKPAEEKYLGMLIEYPAARTAPMPSRSVRLKPAVLGRGKLGVAFIGAGNFAKGVLLPAMGHRPEIELLGVCAASGISAEETGKKFGFSYATTDHKRVIEDPDVNVVFIATRHDTHANMVCGALQAGKHVFVEKPLAVTGEGLDSVIRAYDSLSKPPGEAYDEEVLAGGALPALQVGYNRRFSVHAKAIRNAFKDRKNPLVITYRVNAGTLPADSWVQHPEEGGGRIIGEVCHFVDFCTAITGSLPTTVYADCIRSRDESVVSEDSVVITLHHADGSVSAIQYVALGSSDLPKERVEVHCDGRSAVCEDFKTTTFAGNSGLDIRGRQQKGFAEEISAFLQVVQEGGEPPISFEELIRTSRVTFAIHESLRTGQAVRFDT